MANSDRIIAALNEAWIHFGRFTDENNTEVVEWMQARLRETGNQPVVVVPSVLPRPMTQPPSWYERQPGEEG